MNTILRTTVLCTALIAATLVEAQAPSATSLPAAAADAYRQGVVAEQQEHLDIALERFQAALKQAGNSQACLEAIQRVQIEMGNDKAALATTSKMISTAPDATAKSHAEMLQAEIYYRQSSSYREGGGAYEKDSKKAEDALRKSEAALQHATADDPKDEPLRLLHAHVLAGLHRDEDARHEFEACAATPGTSPAECARALRLSKDTELARFEPATAFEVTTLEGTPLSLSSLAGKVVLVDFWGSWCRYCVRDSSYVQSMLSTFDAKSFVLLEVNEGDSHDVWAAYVKKNAYKGVQVQDTHEQLQSLFHVTGFPTYLILDGDGIIRKRFTGATGDLRKEIRTLIADPAASSTTIAGR